MLRGFIYCTVFRETAWLGCLWRCWRESPLPHKYIHWYPSYTNLSPLFLETRPFPRHISSQNRIPHIIPRLHKQRKHHPHAAQKRRRPRQSHAPNVQHVIHRPAPQIPKAQRIDPPAVHLGDIGGHDRRGEEPDVLEAVLLRGFGADDRRFGLRVEGLVALQRWDQRARRAVVELLVGRFAVVEAGCVDVREKAEDPGGGDGVLCVVLG